MHIHQRKSELLHSLGDPWSEQGLITIDNLGIVLSWRESFKAEN